MPPPECKKIKMPQSIENTIFKPSMSSQVATSTAATCCILGVGNHSFASKKKARSRSPRSVVRTFPSGTQGLVTQRWFPHSLPVACGSPELHKMAIDHSVKTGIPVFVEKPHLIEDYPPALEAKMMIGYNFSYLPLPEDFVAIECKSKGIYRAWPDLFPNKEKYYHAYHTVFVHPIAVIVNRYGKPASITVTDGSSGDFVTTSILFHYPGDGARHHRTDVVSTEDHEACHGKHCESGRELSDESPSWGNNKVLLFTTRGTGFEFNVMEKFGDVLQNALPLCILRI